MTIRATRLSLALLLALGAIPALAEHEGDHAQRGTQTVTLDGNDVRPSTTNLAHAKRVAEARDAWGMEYDTVRLAAGEESRAEALFPHGLPTSALVARGAVTWHERLLTDEALERLVPPLLGAP
jgi:hypothetical protein